MNFTLKFLCFSIMWICIFKLLEHSLQSDCGNGCWPMIKLCWIIYLCTEVSGPWRLWPWTWKWVGCTLPDSWASLGCLSALKRSGWTVTSKRSIIKLPNWWGNSVTASAVFICSYLIWENWQKLKLRIRVWNLFLVGRGVENVHAGSWWAGHGQQEVSLGAVLVVSPAILQISLYRCQGPLLGGAGPERAGGRKGEHSTLLNFECIDCICKSANLKHSLVSCVGGFSSLWTSWFNFALVVQEFHMDFCNIFHRD